MIRAHVRSTMVALRTGTNDGESFFYALDVKTTETDSGPRPMTSRIYGLRWVTPTREAA